MGLEEQRSTPQEILRLANVRTVEDVNGHQTRVILSEHDRQYLPEEIGDARVVGLETGITIEDYRNIDLSYSLDFRTGEVNINKIFGYGFEDLQMMEKIKSFYLIDVPYNTRIYRPHPDKRMTNALLLSMASMILGGIGAVGIGTAGEKLSKPGTMTRRFFNRAAGGVAIAGVLSAVGILSKVPTDATVASRKDREAPAIAASRQMTEEQIVEAIRTMERHAEYSEDLEYLLNAVLRNAVMALKTQMMNADARELTAITIGSGHGAAVGLLSKPPEELRAAIKGFIEEFNLCENVEGFYLAPKVVRDSSAQYGLTVEKTLVDQELENQLHQVCRG
ncbi:hypothetical protein K2Y00_01235 [Patescibacteria group bacterium]|nr:hypothetical protein [Patescibacteria group bacterium]